MIAIILFAAVCVAWCPMVIWYAAHKEAERRADMLRGLVALAVVGVLCGILGGMLSQPAGDGRLTDAEGEPYSFPQGGSGSDAIATGGLWQGAALYEITLSNDAHLVVLYDNTTGTVAMCPWPDPTSPATGYLYVSPLDRDEVLRRIADREDKDAYAMEGYNVYSFDQGRESYPRDDGETGNE